jgi:hypothetical protein
MPIIATFSTPTPGSTLTGSAVTFITINTYPTTFTLGTTYRGADLFNSEGFFYSNTTFNVTGLPTNGSTIYATLGVNNNPWIYFDYTFTAYTNLGPPVTTTKTQTGNSDIKKTTTRIQNGISYIFDIVPPNEIKKFQPTAYYGIAPCQSSSFDNFNHEFEFGYKYGSYFANMDSNLLLAKIMETATLDVVYFDDGVGNYRFSAKAEILGFVDKYKFDVYIGGRLYLTFTSSSPFVNFKIPYALNLDEVGIVATVYLEDGTSEMFPVYGKTSFINQVQYGMADILNTTIRSQSGISYVVYTPQKTQVGIANIIKPIIQNQIGISNITV